MIPTVGSHRDWIQGAVQHPGALHRALHVPQGQPIPAQKMAQAKGSDNEHLRRMAALAETLKKMHSPSHGG